MTDPNFDLKNTAKSINNILISKGYISQNDPIKFDYLTNLHKNDHKHSLKQITKIINVVQKLIDKSDFHTNQIEKLLRSEITAKTEKNLIQEKSRHLEKKYEKTSIEIAKLQQVLNEKDQEIKKLQENYKLLKNESDQYKSELKYTMTKCTNSIRNREYQISQLKKRLRDPPKRVHIPYIDVHENNNNNICSLNVNTSNTNNALNQSNANNALNQSNANSITQTIIQLTKQYETLRQVVNKEYINMKSITGEVQPKNKDEINRIIAVYCPVVAEELADNFSIAVKHVKELLFSRKRKRDSNLEDYTVPENKNITSLTKEVIKLTSENKNLNKNLQEAKSNWQIAMNSLKSWESYYASMENQQKEQVDKEMNKPQENKKQTQTRKPTKIQFVDKSDPEDKNEKETKLTIIQSMDKKEPIDKNNKKIKLTKTINEPMENKLQATLIKLSPPCSNKTYDKKESKENENKLSMKKYKKKAQEIKKQDRRKSRVFVRPPLEEIPNLTSINSTTNDTTTQIEVKTTNIDNKRNGNIIYNLESQYNNISKTIVPSPLRKEYKPDIYLEEKNEDEIKFMEGDFSKNEFSHEEMLSPVKINLFQDMMR